MKIQSLAFIRKSLILLVFATFASISALTINVGDAAAAATDSGSIITGDTNSNVLTNTMCNVQKIVTGNAGKAFAAFAIISVGIAFFSGKVSWGLMVSVAAGIASMFGAATIVSAITGKSTFDCSQ